MSAFKWSLLIILGVLVLAVLVAVAAVVGLFVYANLHGEFFVPIGYHDAGDPAPSVG